MEKGSVGRTILNWVVTDKVTFKPKSWWSRESPSYWRGNIIGRGNSKCKDPQGRSILDQKTGANQGKRKVEDEAGEVAKGLGMQVCVWFSKGFGAMLECLCTCMCGVHGGAGTDLLSIYDCWCKTFSVENGPQGQRWFSSNGSIRPSILSCQSVQRLIWCSIIHMAPGIT